MKHLKDIKDWKEMINTVVCADCIQGMKLMPDNSVDAIVTDPPYGLSFMGKKWDYDVPSVEIWKECLRILKPGGYLLAFAGTRTQHRMACNIEDGGFEIRDMIAWVYGSGFPKSLNIGKAVDKLQGNEREDLGEHPFAKRRPRPEIESNIQAFDKRDGSTTGTNKNLKYDKGTSEWEGWGSSLKPSLEPITVARKPLGEKTIAENCLKWGTGGINIDESRVEYTGQTDPRTFGGSWKTDKAAQNVYEGGYKGTDQTVSSQGRFPANLIHDGSEEVRECFPETTTGSIKPYKNKIDAEFSQFHSEYRDVNHTGDTGNASRFFYCAKASKQERNHGCWDLPLGEAPASARSKPAEGRENALGEPRQNNHPTVKPIALMEYLVRLVSRKDALILDPFTGSGSTLVACKRLDRNFIGFEMDGDYCKIADARVEHWKDQILEYEEEICEGQLNLF